MKTSQAVHILFLQPDRQDHWLNRLTGFVGKLIHGRGACHVEICIPDGNQYLNCSIYNGERVVLNTTKTFANPGYVVHTISLGSDQIARIKAYVAACHAQGLKFDSMGMYLAMSPINLPRNSKGTFCSRLVCEALQKGGVQAVQHLDARVVSPSKLWKILRAVPHACGSVRYKEMQLVQKGSMEVKPLLS